MSVKLVTPTIYRQALNILSATETGEKSPYPTVEKVVKMKYMQIIIRSLTDLSFNLYLIINEFDS
jgi:hypothetical protein